MAKSLLIACVGGLLVSAFSAAQAAEIEDFAGRWQAESVSGAAADLGIEPSDLAVEIAPAGTDGFIVRWTALEPGDRGLQREPVEARFAATERPGVFAFRKDASLLASLFASPEAGNPLAGDRLLWARIEDDTLIVYGLALDRDGSFVLDRYARTLEDRSLSVDQTVRTGTGEPLRVEGRLVPAGG